MQLCPCNPNTGRNAKSSLPAVVSHPSFCAVAGKTGEREGGGGGTGRQKRQGRRQAGEGRSGSRFLAPFWDSPARRVIQFLPDGDLVRMWTAWVRGRRAQPDTFTNCSGLSLSRSGGSVNMTFWVCVQRQHAIISIYRFQRQHERSRVSARQKLILFTPREN